jgi:MFS family permease
MRWRTLAALTLAELLAISPWFAGTVVLQELETHWAASFNVAVWLTIAVQVGFVTGALTSASLNLADVFPAPRVMWTSAVLAASANAAFAEVAADHMKLALAARFATGFFLAGVYPTAMKIMAGWFREGRGTALGILIGALTIGSASPYLIKSVILGREWTWQTVVNVSTVSTLIGALLVVLFVREGPFASPTPRFDFHQVGQTFRNRRLFLANMGYWGHMWEVYTMWGWIGGMLLNARFAHGVGLQRDAALDFERNANLWAFVAVALGALGCVVAGRFSDRKAVSQLRQRSNVTIAAMAVSGCCCLAAALAFGHFALFVAISLVWGISVVADSAQFSAIVTEVSDQRYVGTALTTQLALGFILTAVSLQLFGWMIGRGHIRLAIALLAVGPALGILAMSRLKATTAASAVPAPSRR